MISVILSILKIILLIIACIIGLLILALCLILFVPIRYEASGRSYEEISAKGRVSWLLGIFCLRITYIEKNFKLKITILGIPINLSDNNQTKGFDYSDEDKTKKLIFKNDKKPQKFENKQENKTDKTADKELNNKVDNKLNNKLNNKVGNKQDNNFDNNTKKKSIFSRILEIIKLVKDIIIKVLRAIKSILVKIYNFLLQIKDEESSGNKFSKIKDFLKENKLGIKVVIKAIKELLNHIRPRKFSGDLEFGTDDPSVTGQILGVTSIFYGLYCDNFKLIPNFEQKVLKGQVCFNGKIRLFTIFIIGLKLLFNNNFRSLWNNYNVLKEEF